MNKMEKKHYAMEFGFISMETEEIVLGEVIENAKQRADNYALGICEISHHEFEQATMLMETLDDVKEMGRKEQLAALHLLFRLFELGEGLYEMCNQLPKHVRNMYLDTFFHYLDKRVYQMIGKVDACREDGNNGIL